MPVSNLPALPPLPRKSRKSGITAGDGMEERCSLCGCRLHRTADTYARPTVEGRSHATRHHFVAERFFGRSNNRRGEQRDGIFDECPWGMEGKSAVYCYECHEELLHNPVFLPEDIARFAKLLKRQGLSEDEKPSDRNTLAERIRFLHRVIAAGLRVLETDQDAG